METFEEKLAKLEEALKGDIRWAIEEGPGWDPDSPAIVLEADDGNGLCFANQSNCGLCAIGARVVRHGMKPTRDAPSVIPPLRYWGDNYSQNQAVAKEFDLDLKVVEVIFDGVTVLLPNHMWETWLDEMGHEPNNQNMLALEVAQRLREFANDLDETHNG